MALIKIKTSLDLKRIFSFCLLMAIAICYGHSIIHFLIDVEATQSVSVVAHTQLKSKSNLTILG